MLNIKEESYGNVFQVDVREKFVISNLSTSVKNTDADGNVTYENDNWRVMYFGKAAELARTLQDKDRIKIMRGRIRRPKWVNPSSGETRYDPIVHIFEFEIIDNRPNATQSQSKPKDTNKPANKPYPQSKPQSDYNPDMDIDSDDLPF